MSQHIAIDPIEFISAVRPLLEQMDLTGFSGTVLSRWNEKQIASLLRSKNCDARKVAALALGIVGGTCCIPLLAERLGDSDPFTNQMAEHALWSVWFRLGSAEANQQLARGAMAMQSRQFDRALTCFDAAIGLSPDFAEAYNQRAIGWYLQDRFEPCIADCRRAIDLMPCHFGAWAGMGHCHAHREQSADAIRCYCRALEINPHLECVRQTIGELSRQTTAPVRRAAR